MASAPKPPKPSSPSITPPARPSGLADALPTVSKEAYDALAAASDQLHKDHEKAVADLLAAHGELELTQQALRAVQSRADELDKELKVAQAKLAAPAVVAAAVANVDERVLRKAQALEAVVNEAVKSGSINYTKAAEALAV